MNKYRSCGTSGIGVAQHPQHSLYMYTRYHYIPCHRHKCNCITNWCYPECCHYLYSISASYHVHVCMCIGSTSPCSTMLYQYCVSVNKISWLCTVVHTRIKWSTRTGAGIHLPCGSHNYYTSHWGILTSWHGWHYIVHTLVQNCTLPTIYVLYHSTYYHYPIWCQVLILLWCTNMYMVPEYNTLHAMTMCYYLTGTH